MTIPRARPLLASLPLPLAQLLLRAINAKSSVEHHHCAYYLVEAAIKLGAAARIGLWLSCTPPADHPLRDGLRALSMPSIGHWRGLLRDVDRELSTLTGLADHPLTHASQSLEGRRLFAVRTFIDAAHAHGVIHKELRRSAVKTGVRGFLDVLVSYRNEVLGHGAQRSDAFYTEVGPLLLAAAVELLDSDTVVGGLPLVVPSSTVESGQSVTRWVGLTGLAGVPVDAPATTGPFAEGRLYLAGPSALIPLHPLVVWVRPPSDPMGRVGFLNKALHRSSRDGLTVVKRAEFLDYTTGQALEGVDCRRELSEFLSDVGAGVGDISEVDEQLDSEEVPVDVGGPQGPAAFGQPDPTPLQSRPNVGDFVLLEELGRGGMGIVWKARQLGMGRIVALKVLSRALAGDATARERFQREIRALARSDHPNVVRVLSDGEEDGQLYYAMEYVDGSDLSHVHTVLSGWRSQGARLHADSLGETSEASETPPRTEPAGAGTLYVRLARLFADVADGVQHLHDQGVIHRDLKPSNLMLTADGMRLVIADLGLAKLDDASKALTGSGVKVLGTLRYMPPEQLQRNLLEVDGRADIYALGVSLTELCTGQRFFDGDTEQRLITQVLNEDPPAPSARDPELPEDLSRVLQKATEKRADDRYATAAELAADLRAFAEDRPVSVRRPGVLRRMGMALRRNPAVAAYLKMAAVVLATLGLGTWAALFALELMSSDAMKYYATVEPRHCGIVGAGWMPDRARMSGDMQVTWGLLGWDIHDPDVRSGHFALTYRAGWPERIEYLPGPDDTEDDLQPLYVQRFGLDGRLLGIDIETPQGTVTRRVRVEWLDDDVCLRTFADADGRPSLHPHLEVSAERVQLDADGRYVERTFLDADGSSTRALGISRMHWSTPDADPVCFGHADVELPCPHVLVAEL